MIELKPIIESTEEYDEIEQRIKKLFKEHIYFPLLKEFSQSQKTLKNARDDLLEAFRSGRLTFNRGKISGRLNATLTKELRSIGATWDKRQKCFSISQNKLPSEIRNVIYAGEVHFQQKMQRIDRHLASVVPEQLAEKLKIADIFDRTLWKVEKEFHQSVKNITVPPQISDTTREKIAEEWQNNMHLWIKDFTQEQITKLREDIRANVLKGNRYDSMIDSIQKNYGVTANKAKFLARQETAVMMTKYKQGRYQDVGINQYKWKSVQGSKLHPVRPRHKELNDASMRGKLFTFDDPPITSEAGQPTRRNNPGEDYNCRCRAIPIINFKKSNPANFAG